MGSSKPEGQLTLNQMLKAIPDKDVAAGIETRLKKLSKKKALQAPLEGDKARKIERVAAYSDVSKEISKWEPVVEKNRKAKHLSFPLNQQPERLPTSAECLSDLKPSTKLERDVHNVLCSTDTVLHDNKEFSKAEENYLKAIDAEEAQERHKELQRMRVLLSSYAAKMRRQKAIKSKSYRRLLKHERIRGHMKKVESNKDLLMDEIERLQRLRAQERASLKHKNTGKWAKHAKFRAKYDENARQAMLEQIGLASKLLEKPASGSESDSDDEDEISEVSSDDESSDNEEANTETMGASANNKTNSSNIADSSDRLIVSTELIDKRASNKRRNSDEEDYDSSDVDGSDDADEDPQRKLMSEAFAGDDVVKEFKKTKAKLVQQEQPKDIDLFLPGWGDWAGPGLKVNKKKRKKFVLKAKKLPRRDDKLNHVIISEQTNEGLTEIMTKRLPRGIKDKEQMVKMLLQPTAATFTSQHKHRELTRPRIETKMGARIEPIKKSLIDKGHNSAKWA